MNQNDLFPAELARPNSYDKAIVQKAAEVFGQKMHRSYSDWSAEEWAEDIVKVYAPHKDGYEIAKDLERHGYDPDAQMVSDLDDFHFEVSSALSEAVKHWVAQVGFEPIYAEGDHVDLKPRFGRDKNHGIISGIRHDTAEYLVKTDPQSSSALIVAAEEIQGFNNN